MSFANRAEKIIETLCRCSRKDPGELIFPLTVLGKNRKAEVTHLQTENRSALQKMIAMGMLPKTKVSLIQTFPSYVLQIGKSQFAIDKELAENVYVRIT